MANSNASASNSVAVAAVRPLRGERSELGDGGGVGRGGPVHHLAVAPAAGAETGDRAASITRLPSSTTVLNTLASRSAGWCLAPRENGPAVRDRARDFG